MGFKLKSFQQILNDMIAKFLSATGVNDINDGSVLTTFLEAASQEDAQQYYQMYQIIRNFNLDTTEGDDLDVRAVEFGLERNEAQKATGVVTIGDTAVTKKSTKIYAGNRGPIAGQTSIDVDNASAFDPTGTIIIGRSTGNVETIAYTSITNFTQFFRINLAGGLTNDHGTDESVILAQGGDRTIPLGTIVKVLESDTSSEITFSINEEAVILNGEEEVEDVPFIAVSTGTASNVPAGTIIEFDTLPFTTATVSNPFSITNGIGKETDSELRDRIKDHIQGLARGTTKAIQTGIAGIVDPDENKRVVSSKIIEPTTLEDLAFIFIDDGTGFEPSSSGQGEELVLDEATGNEKFLQLDNFPSVKAEVETQNEEPFPITNGLTLTLAVNDVEETIVFEAEDLKQEGLVTAFEVAQIINDNSTLVEARTTGESRKVVLRAVENVNEKIRVVGGTANTATILNFPTEEVESLYLYKFAAPEGLTLLSKDGITAAITVGSPQPYALSGGETLTVVVDGKTINTQTVTFLISDFVAPGSATAAEVAARINLELVGAIASVTDKETRITITSGTENSSSSKINVTGGTANAELGFSLVEVVGTDKGYTLNRFNGQIELENEAEEDEQYTAGSIRTRGTALAGKIQTYSLTTGDTITLKVDGGAGQVITFLTGDFGDISAATTQEVADVINRDGVGVFAEPTDDNRLSIRTNTWDESIGSIEVDAVTGTATDFDFSVGTISDSINPHVGVVISASTQPYSFSEGDVLFVVMDDDAANSTSTITMDLDGEVTIGDAVPAFETLIAKIDSTGENFNIRFKGDDDLTGFTLKWLTGDNFPGTNTIADYDASTGLMTLDTPEGASIDVTDTFTIIPVTAKNVATYLGNTITSSLPVKADVETAVNGTKVQIASKTPGTSGAVQVTGGTANAELAFSTTQVLGIDAYRFYTGLLRRVQHLVNGLDTDFTGFPGLAAAGVQIEVLAPTVRKVNFEIDLTLDESITLPIINDKTVNAVSSYINGLKVGEDVILSEITDRLMDIDGVVDVSFTTPTENVAIADNEVARVSDNQIIFS